MRKAKADQIPSISSNSKQRNLSPQVSKAVRDFGRGFVEQTLIILGKAEMIKTKEDLKYYIKRDYLARYGKKKPTINIKIKTGIMFRYNVVLRKAEYHLNNDHKVASLFYRFRLYRLGLRLGWSIDPNTFGPGMCIVHYGTVIVNPNARIGENARLQAGVNIGANAGENAAPQIGDNVYFGPGAKVFGNIIIASNVAIGANAVVNKSCLSEGVTLGGVPARIISQNGTERMITR